MTDDYLDIPEFLRKKQFEFNFNFDILSWHITDYRFCPPLYRFMLDPSGKTKTVFLADGHLTRQTQVTAVATENVLVAALKRSHDKRVAMVWYSMKFIDGLAELADTARRKLKNEQG